MNIHQRLTRYWISSLISGASSLIGGVVSEHAADKRAQLNREAQKEENQLNRDWQEMMYNKYESPAAQQQQMLAAGLNPMGAVTPQSVGSASTSSLPTNDGPGAGAGFGSAIQNTVPAIYEAAMSQRALRQADLEATSTELDNWKKAFENGNAEELYEITKKEIESRTTLNRYQARVKKRELRDLDFTYKKAKEAYEAGANEFTDAHNLTEAQIQSINKSVEESSARINEINSKLPYEIKLLDSQSFLASESAQDKVFDQKLKEQQRVLNNAFGYIRELGNIYNIASAIELNDARIEDLRSQDFYRYVNTQLTLIRNDIDMIMQDKSINSQQLMQARQSVNDMLTNIFNKSSKK